MGTGQWIGGCRGDGWGSHMVNGLQRRGSFHTSLSARNRGDSEGWRRDGKPGLEGKGKHELPEQAVGTNVPIRRRLSS